MCHACGGNGQVACVKVGRTDRLAKSGCNAGLLAGKDGKCYPCGGNGQYPCVKLQGIAEPTQYKGKKGTKAAKVAGKTIYNSSGCNSGLILNATGDKKSHACGGEGQFICLDPKGCKEGFYPDVLAENDIDKAKCLQCGLEGRAPCTKAPFCKSGLTPNPETVKCSSNPPSPTLPPGIPSLGT
jgi:hypothetical protein